MSDPPSRRWFQIHLSTALILTITAGALMGGNMVLRRQPEIELYPLGGRQNAFVYSCGWPWVYRTHANGVELIRSTAEDRKGLNFWFAVLALPGLAVFLEILIRRRDRERTK